MGRRLPDVGNDRLSWGRSRQHRNYTYISFDNAVVRNGARADPLGFVADLPERVILDEIQRVPDLFEAIKIEVDRHRVPGRFVLTGSTNVLLLPDLSESLAGRLQIVRLHPLAQYELATRDAPSPTDAGFLHTLFGDGFAIRQTERLGERLPVTGLPVVWCFMTAKPAFVLAIAFMLYRFDDCGRRLECYRRSHNGIRYMHMNRLLPSCGGLATIRPIVSSRAARPAPFPIPEGSYR